MVAGADCIDDADVLRSGSTAAVLAHKVMAPSTLGTFLRRFSFGHVRQLDKVSEAMLTRAWSAGAGPGAEPMTIDMDSTICPVHGDHKQGAAFGYTKVLGYHPLLGDACRDRRGPPRPVPKGIGRIGTRGGALRPRARRACATRRVDRPAHASRRLGLLLPPRREGLPGPRGLLLDHRAAERQRCKRAIEAIDEEAWVPIDYTDAGEAWVAETTYGDGHRLVVRRTQASPIPSRRSSPPSATTPSSPTGSATRSSSTPTTGATRSSSSRSGT